MTMPSGFTISICCYLMFVMLLFFLLKLLTFVCAGVRKMMVQNQKLTQKEIDPRNLPALLPSPHRCCNGSSEETSLHCCPPYPNMSGHMLAFTKLLMLTLLLCKDTITTLRKVEA